MPAIGTNYADWPAFWDQAVKTLRKHGYQTSTLLFYRQILRSFSRFSGKPPSKVSPHDLHHYLAQLGSQNNSWHWTAMSISVIRTLFDKIAGLKALDQLQGPRRKQPLPEYLDHEEVRRLLEATDTLRDQLLIALLYGCGLKLHELQRLKWDDLELKNNVILVSSRNGNALRRLSIPTGIRSVLHEGHSHCSGHEYLFPGRKTDHPLSSRIIQLTLRKCAERAGIEKIVTTMTLRHSFAVHQLDSGVHIRELQVMLDHKLTETTLRYIKCIPFKKTPATQNTVPADVTLHPHVQTTCRSMFPLLQPKRFFKQLITMKLRGRFMSHRGYDTG